MRPSFHYFLIALFALAVRPVSADDPKPDEAKIKAAREQRLSFMKEKLKAFEVRTDAEPSVGLTLSEEPALRWTNPIRGVDGDGATFFWSEGGRPVAIATISIRTGGRTFREFALLGDRPIVARREGQVIWSPRKNAMAFEPLAEAPIPAKSPAQRLTQVKAMARRFRISLIKEQPVEGRLMPQPLLRYSAPDSGVIDGAVFAFAEANDPEALLLLEARRDEAHPDGRWTFSVARMTSPQVEVRLEDKLLWTGLPYWKNTRTREDPYVEAFEGDYEGKPD